MVVALMFQSKNMGQIIELKPGEQNIVRDVSERKCLTVEKLRTFKGCEHYNDAEAFEVVESIKTLSLILLDMVRDEARIEENENKLKQAA